MLGVRSATGVVRPANPTEVASILRDASDSGLAVVPWGGGTQQHLGGPPSRCDLVLLTTGLHGISAYAPKDLTVSVGAGTTIAELKHALDEYGQFLPLDVPRPEQATVGGAIATAVSSIRRSRYGTARDMVIGLTVALPNGSLCKSGGQVVKNVAGYDLCKLFTGSLGTLGVVVSANFKVFPRPKRTLLVRSAFADDASAFAAATSLCRMSQYYSFIIVESGLSGVGTTVSALIEGFSGTLDRQVDAARDAMNAGTARPSLLVDEEAHDAVTELIARHADTGDTTVVFRGAVAPRNIAQAWSNISGILGRAGLEPSVQADATTGTYVGSLSFDEAQLPSVRTAIEALRGELRQVHGHLKIAGGTSEFRASVDSWGAAPSAEALSRTIKTRLDPHCILNPGRFAYGI
jgi:glycolate oxidase FAD binding subunit